MDWSSVKRQERSCTHVQPLHTRGGGRGMANKEPIFAKVTVPVRDRRSPAEGFGFRAAPERSFSLFFRYILRSSEAHRRVTPPRS